MEYEQFMTHNGNDDDDDDDDYSSEFIPFMNTWKIGTNNRLKYEQLSELRPSVQKEGILNGNEIKNPTGISTSIVVQCPEHTTLDQTLQISTRVIFVLAWMFDIPGWFDSFRWMNEMRATEK